MKHRTLLLLLLTNSLIGAALAVWINVVTANDFVDRLKLAGLYEYRGYILVGFIILSLVLVVLIFRHQQIIDQHDKPTHVPEAEAQKARREFLDDLTLRYKTRYEHKMDGRFEISLVVSDYSANTPSQQFDEEFTADAYTGSAAQYIIECFEKRGRLLIVGSPGAGKTVLLLRLARHLAEKAQKDATQPLPVIFNLASWSPEYERFDDWLMAVLTEGYGLSPAFAALMLREGQIVFLLDGLDEIARNEEATHAAEVRAQCLKAINKSLYDGLMNAVICCRREEFLAMRELPGAVVPVAAQVVVQDLTAEQIERALIRASSSEKDRFAALHLLQALGGDSNEIYMQVLTTPFYFTLALHVFDYSEPPDLPFDNKQTLETNLIKGFIEKKLEITENSKNFRPADTLKWLSWLAAFLETRKRVTFELADLQPDALKKKWWYKVADGAVVGLLGFAILSQVVNWALGLFFGIVAGFTQGGDIVTQDIAKWTWSPLLRWRAWKLILRQTIGIGFFVIPCCVWVVLVGQVLSIPYFNAYSAFIVGSISTLSSGIIEGVADVCRKISSFARVNEPYQRLRAGIVFNVLQTTGFIAFVTLAAFAVGARGIYVDWAYFAMAVGCGLLLGFSTTPLFGHYLLRICLWLEDSMPLKYVTFLRYANKLRILEQEGGQWRFRHQNFQDYFATRTYN